MDDVYLFNMGENFQAYKYFGSFPETRDGVEGFRFAVWAPHALAVNLSGDFNDWATEGMPLELNHQTGVWTGFYPGLEYWQRYKYAIKGQDRKIVLKADPFARHEETRPGTASILYDVHDYAWQDEAWMNERKHALDTRPLNIYEMHLGSWRRYEDGNTINYADLADQLVSYLLRMGYNAVEFMPLSEYPFDDSWGYQVTGYFSITSRYGTPAQFKYLVDKLHQAGILVIMDWVPAHFPRDEFGLARFDGEPLYEYADTRLGEHPEWGTLVFDYSKNEVVSFLKSSAWFWLEECHIDGLRVDAVSSMIYLDYGRNNFVRNKDGGNINLDAVAFLQELNSLVRERYPAVMMIAEESTSFPYVTQTAENGGMGFTHKWNMGWMHDTLKYMSLDYLYRRDHHNQITFSMTYAFSERYVLPFSHDEVVHGKHSLLDKMPGDPWRKFASLRLMLMYQIAHPGAKLNFMGYEIGQFVEWRFKEELEWFLLDFEAHAQHHAFVAELNHMYLESPEFWARDDSWSGFTWQQVSDYQNSVIAFARYDNDESCMLCIYNMTPATLPVYKLQVPDFGTYEVVLNSDDKRFGGSAYVAEDTRGMLLVTEISDRETATRMMEKRRASLQLKQKQLGSARRDLIDKMGAYYSELRNLYEIGAISLGNKDASVLDSESLEKTLLDATVLVPEIVPELELTLPPLSAIYLRLIKPETE